MKPIISVQNLSKRYKLGVFNAKTLREEAEAFLSRFSRKNAKLAVGSSRLAAGSSHAEPSSDFWALRDVSFDVQPGEVIGVIGRNGAGKSTLLKILSRITEPTSGEARIRGRVASLLEVGTGFHPELSGRENIFLNGAILGMTKQEIRNKFDEIVAFAEIEKFIDTPVKRYSSGMYVRLAFAVAAHLEPEILIVDEVLAVGDMQFQQKCLNKMRDIGTGGRTVLFVSHNLGAVQSLCSRAVWLAGGQIHREGEVFEITRDYASSAELAESYALMGPLKSDVRLLSVSVLNSEGDAGAVIRRDEPLVVEALFEADSDISRVQAFVGIDSMSIRVVSIPNSVLREDFAAGQKKFIFRVPAWFLRPGTYQVGVGLNSKDGHDWVWAEAAAHFEVLRHYRSDTDRQCDGLVDLPLISGK